MSFNDSTIEPKNVFLTLLIGRITLLQQVIYDQRELRTGLTMMLGLIDLLDTTSQETLETERKKISTMLNGTYTKEEVYQTFSTIIKYLHKTYLQEVSMGLIPTSVLTGKDKKPENKAADPNKSSRL